MESAMRPSGRATEAMRPITLEPGVAHCAGGWCLARFGDTHVLCTATVEERVPPFLRNTGRGWVPAAYGMLPRSTHNRTAPAGGPGLGRGRSGEPATLAPAPPRSRGGARQAERAHAGNPAADRPQPARRY